MKTRLFRVKAFSVLAVVAMAVTFAFTSCSNNDDPTLGSGGASLTEVDGNFVVKEQVCLTLVAMLFLRSLPHQIIRR